MAARTDLALTQARRDGAFIVYAHNAPLEKDFRALLAEADRARVRDARKEPPVFGQRCQVWVSGTEQWYFAYWVRPGGFEYAESGQRAMLPDCFLWLPEPDRPRL